MVAGDEGWGGEGGGEGEDVVFGDLEEGRCQLGVGSWVEWGEEKVGGEGSGAGGEADVVEFIPVQRAGFIDDGCAVAFVSEV